MIGRSYKVGIAKETIRGTVATPTYWIPLLEMPSIENKSEYKTNEQGVGVIADSDNSIVVSKNSVGEISGKIRDKSIGMLFLATLGEVTSEGVVGDTGIYDHTFALKNDNAHPAMTLNIKNDLQQLAYPLSMLSSFNLLVEQKDYVRFTAGFMGKKGVASTETPAYDIDEHEFIARHVEVKIADDIVGLSSATAIAIQGCETSIEKNVEPIYTISDEEPYDISNTVISAEGNIEGRFEDLTMKTLVEGSTTKALQITITHDTMIGTASYPTITIVFPKVAFQEWDKNGGMNEIVGQTIKFKAHYSLVDAMFAEITLRNEVTAY